jgi:hypothetical protein
MGNFGDRAQGSNLERGDPLKSCRGLSSLVQKFANRRFSLIILLATLPQAGQPAARFQRIAAPNCS